MLKLNSLRCVASSLETSEHEADCEWRVLPCSSGEMCLFNGESFIRINASPMQSGLSNVVIIYQACDSYMKISSFNVSYPHGEFENVVLAAINERLAELVSYWNSCRSFVMTCHHDAGEVPRPWLPNFVSCEYPLSSKAV